MMINKGKFKVKFKLNSYNHNSPLDKNRTDYSFVRIANWNLNAN